MPSKPAVWFEGEYWRLCRLSRESAVIKPFAREGRGRPAPGQCACKLRVDRTEIAVAPIDSPPRGRRYEGWGTGD